MCNNFIKVFIRLLVIIVFLINLISCTTLPDVKTALTQKVSSTCLNYTTNTNSNPAPASSISTPTTTIGTSVSSMGLKYFDLLSQGKLDGLSLSIGDTMEDALTQYGNPTEYSVIFNAPYAKYPDMWIGFKYYPDIQHDWDYYRTSAKAIKIKSIYILNGSYMGMETLKTTYDEVISVMGNEQDNNRWHILFYYLNLDFKEGKVLNYYKGNYMLTFSFTPSGLLQRILIQYNPEYITTDMTPAPSPQSARPEGQAYLDTLRLSEPVIDGLTLNVSVYSDAVALYGEPTEFDFNGSGGEKLCMGIIKYIKYPNKRLFVTMLINKEPVINDVEFIDGNVMGLEINNSNKGNIINIFGTPDSMMFGKCPSGDLEVFDIEYHKMVYRLGNTNLIFYLKADILYTIGIY